MDTVNLIQLIAADGGVYLLGDVPFSGFAIENFPDGRLATQMALMHGRQDGVTRRWHPNGQLESEKAFRSGQPHGRHTEWHADGTLKEQSSWNAGVRIPSGERDGTGGNPPSTAPGNFVKHYRYDPEGRLTSVRIEEAPDAAEENPYPITYVYTDPQRAADGGSQAQRES